MKRKILTGSIIGFIVLGGAVGVSAVSGNVDGGKSSTGQELISMEKAKEIALKEAQGTVESIELDKGYGQDIYEIDIENKNDDVDVKINAKSGEVVKIEKEHNIDDDNNEPATKVKITQEEAIELAQKAKQGKVVEIELDDNQYYDIEMKNGNEEIELKIDANNGKIVEEETDWDND
ncbi:putative membrane protein YkoI [Bacillus pakistanensis]|uniref:Membrane protein YkoI n=1 Tax=Rossellomorea pakistanensis TaxID=992288 RepID=A0ABS2NE69_9BACI|nr:PepSY domain-containing protein [Bacillus pakistanensis]MBM7586146.1 putative membrane protein YkoI [Bacillus pakistanensis]